MLLRGPDRSFAVHTAHDDATIAKYVLYIQIIYGT